MTTVVEPPAAWHRPGDGASASTPKQDHRHRQLPPSSVHSRHFLRKVVVVWERGGSRVAALRGGAAGRAARVRKSVPSAVRANSGTGGGDREAGRGRRAGVCGHGVAADYGPAPGPGRGQSPPRAHGDPDAAGGGSVAGGGDRCGALPATPASAMLRIRHGTPEFVPPEWLDPERKPIRNTAHHPPSRRGRTYLANGRQPQRPYRPCRALSPESALDT
ncbi:hypothetical protein SAMN05216266_10489 [Amycolatopsis marina]|uniref:Uncharacterized protein n=1 Tax=Amycolatopsis marina TaxID=490629 RepID=A0A1I0XWV9_9PSEU|nr:hypothetical protein SAMN05216266_10489 [Amycolatopsis marina]